MFFKLTKVFRFPIKKRKNQILLKKWKKYVKSPYKNKGNPEFLEERAKIFKFPILKK